ncbi:MAG: cell division protein FtsZ [Cyclobacteriaceae bacterium]|jgi:cell division protein FtsZ
MNENTYSFDLPSHHKSIIKVIGVGGGGSNAVNHMYNMGIRDVEFVVCNTDRQALESSPVPNKLQIGVNLTSGLGAGANPEKGRNAAIESKEEIKELLSDNTKMIFVTAGMGGGTGTGGAPVIAQVAREMDILTVGIVTAPFRFEGKKKLKQAEEGIAALKASCDTVIVISNDKIKEIYGNLPISEAFSQADNVLTTAAKGIAEIITVPGYVNVDFEDVKTVMSNAGAAVMGSAQTSGENRARRAAEAALNSPLLNNHKVFGAKKILLSIMSGEEAELQMDELADITDYMHEFAGEDAEVIFGHGVEAELGDEIRVTVIVTGFDSPAVDSTEEETADMELHVRPSSDGASEDMSDQVPKFDLEIQPRYQEPTYDDHEPDEETQTVFDLESKRRIKQISLFEKGEDQDDEELELSNESTDFMGSDDNGVSNDDRFDFDFDITDEDEQTSEKETYAFDFEESSFEAENESESEEEEDALLEDLKEMAHPPSHRFRLLEERKKREEKLNQAKHVHQQVSPESYKEKWEVPAYERKKVNLKQVPHSSTQNISRYNLNDDNKIIGNNKFLHDNVD